ncbi:GSCOCG00010865001-RA-CDS [Cotesia congregata]|nr:GSCOCG00010865001-RA-CDS [Cotesia congregata]
MVAIGILEERITELENRIYGAAAPAIDATLPETSIVDNILHANTLISSALSGRERTNALVKRLPQLNELLDTSYENDDLNIEAKLEIIIAMESEIKKNLELFNKVQELMPALEINKIQNVPELTPKLEHLTVNYLNLYEESNQISQSIHKVFSKYNNIIDTISKSLISLDAAITAAEKAAAPKKRQDD